MKIYACLFCCAKPCADQRIPPLPLSLIPIKILQQLPLKIYLLANIWGQEMYNKTVCRNRVPIQGNRVPQSCAGAKTYALLLSPTAANRVPVGRPAAADLHEKAGAATVCQYAYSISGALSYGEKVWCSRHHFRAHDRFSELVFSGFRLACSAAPNRVPISAIRLCHCL